ncbi:MAG: hypothetical protein QM796_01270 [Chthoniobacteraceae bacterium]
MIKPPPLPAASRESQRVIRIGLGIASIATILAGQIITKGALYGYSFMGISLGIIATLKNIFSPTGGGGYLLMIAGVIIIIALMILLFVGLLLGFGVTIYIAARRRVSPGAVRLASFLFAGVAASTFLGLALSRLLPSQPDFHGEIHIEVYFFIWPVLFAVLSFSYGMLFRSYRSA